MFSDLDFNKLLTLFKFDPADPLLFNSSMFLFLFIGLFALYLIFSGSRRVQVWLLIGFSFFFYYKSSGLYFLLLPLSAFINFYAGSMLFKTGNYTYKKLYLSAAIFMNLGLLVYFKYTNFFIQIVNDVSSSALTPLDIFLPIGISFYTFKALSYILDIFLEKMEPEKNFGDFLLYISFFPNILAGPIDRADRFLPQLKEKLHIPQSYVGKGVLLICSGLIKKAIIADYISYNFVDRIFDYPTRFTGVENLIG
ncbi:MAG: hypothetical protein ACM3Q2_18930, partial [Syntrophothermus sp.]